MNGELVVLFHGPDIFDKGHAKRIISLFDEARFYQAGTMGRTAAHDNGLDEVVTIPDLPGKVIARSGGIGSLIIAISPRSLSSGKSFARLILDNSKVQIPVLHLDCRTKKYVIWQGRFSESIIGRIENMGFSIDSPMGDIKHFEFNGNEVKRYLQDCKVGDFVLCNNIIIGKALETKVSITARDGRIVDTSGIDVKEHGIEKLDYFGKLDIMRAKCCSTSNLREDFVDPRVKKCDGDGVVFINHSGADVYGISEGCEGAVVVGDDTSRIVGDILYRFGKPIIAITDGDRDGLIKHDRFFEKSRLYLVDFDDEVGMDIYNELFQNNIRLDLPFQKVKNLVHDYIEDRVLEVKEY